MVKFETISDNILAIAKRLGFNGDGDSKNGIFRQYSDSRGYLAFINPDESESGPYSGLSFVVFPLYDDSSYHYCVVSICIGRNNLGDDLELASLPYLRRSFRKMTKGDVVRSDFPNIYLTTDFTDVTTPSTKLFEDLETLAKEWGSDDSLKTINSYKTVLPAARIVRFTNDDVYDAEKVDSRINRSGNAINGYDVLIGWLAQYAKIRKWEYRKGKAYDRQDKLSGMICEDDQYSSTAMLDENGVPEEVENLLNEKKYIVLQGAPGTGKTYTANQLSKEFEKVFFEQFHAETTFSDFVGGIRPVLNSKEIGYEYHEGKLTEAIVEAINLENKGKKVLLIIDEINRANLSNVLGPVFYLFEGNVNSKNDRKGKVQLHLSNSHRINDYDDTKYTVVKDKDYVELSALPSNLYVIATMNTADRSLAVVDFALRRRFAWYTLKPHEPVQLDNSLHFCKEEFHKVGEFFEKYATDEEMNLQPGQSYFIVNNGTELQIKEAMKKRMIYEIMPLMKEYFANGLMLKAQDEFADYYHLYTNQFMYL